MSSGIKAVIFDLGGVVLTSPLAFIRDFETRQGLEEGFVARLLGSYGEDADSPWHALERGELGFDAFCESFDEVAQGRGHEFDSRELMLGLSGSSTIRPLMVQAVRELKAAGFATAALTNIWAAPGGIDRRMEELSPEFDVFLESYRIGMRKPEVRIYEAVRDALNIDFAQGIFLDDIGTNLKVARGLGLHTIKVQSPTQALSDLETALGIILPCVAGRLGGTMR